MNLYAYVDNNPVNYVDPLGLLSWTEFKEIVSSNLKATPERMTDRMVDLFNYPTDNPGQVIAFIALGQLSIVADVGAAHNAANGLRLSKNLASQAQMCEEGTIMAGSGARVPFRDAGRFAQSFCLKIPDWVKKTSSSYTPSVGNRFETHWIENTKTGQRVEFKTKFP